jgi:hypothetical protein
VEEAPEQVRRTLGPQLLARVQLEPVLGRKDLAKSLPYCEGHNGYGHCVHDHLKKKHTSRQWKWLLVTTTVADRVDFSAAASKKNFDSRASLGSATLITTLVHLFLFFGVFNIFCIIKNMRSETQIISSSIKNKIPGDGIVNAYPSHQ